MHPCDFSQYFSVSPHETILPDIVTNIIIFTLIDINFILLHRLTSKLFSHIFLKKALQSLGENVID